MPDSDRLVFDSIEEAVRAAGGEDKMLAFINGTNLRNALEDPRVWNPPVSYFQWTTGRMEVTDCVPDICNHEEVFWAWDRSRGAWVHYARR